MTTVQDQELLATIFAQGLLIFDRDWDAWLVGAEARFRALYTKDDFAAALAHARQLAADPDIANASTDLEMARAMMCYEVRALVNGKPPAFRVSVEPVEDGDFDFDAAEDDCEDDEMLADEETALAPVVLLKPGTGRG